MILLRLRGRFIGLRKWMGGFRRLVILQYVRTAALGIEQLYKLFVCWEHEVHDTGAIPHTNFFNT